MNLMLANNMEFNDEQIDAIKAVHNGAVLVTAGAGTGKTTVLIAAAVELLTREVRPWEILVVTFTNKAANEIKSRIRERFASSEDMRWLGTFHSVCLKILRRNAE